MQIPADRRLLPVVTDAAPAPGVAPCASGRAAMTCRYRCGDACAHDAPNTSGNETFAELREARGLFPMARFGDDFDGYVKDQVAGFKELATEVGLTQ